MGYFAVFRVFHGDGTEEGGGDDQTPTEQRAPYFLPKTEHRDPPLSSQGGCLVYCLTESTTLHFPHLLLVVAVIALCAVYSVVFFLVNMLNPCPENKTPSDLPPSNSKIRPPVFFLDI